MFTTEVILAVLVTALVAGGSGYYLARKFWTSNYSRTNTSGDFGGPRGGVFALASGCLIGMMFASLASHIGLFSGNASAAAFITAMVVGLFAGVVGSFKTVLSKDKDQKPGDAKKDDGKGGAAK